MTPKSLCKLLTINAIYVLATMLLNNVALAQNKQEPIRCAVDNAAAPQKHAHSPGKPYFESWLEQKQQTQKLARLHQNNDLEDTTIAVIPVVFHIIHSGEALGAGTNIPEARIKTQIRILNEDYRRKAGTRGFNTMSQGADAQIEFVLASTTPDGVASNGIVRINGNKTSWRLDEQASLKEISRWSSGKYLNIWICNLETYLGYSSFPTTDLLEGLPSQTDSLLDGVILNYKYVGESPLSSIYNLGRSATHEIGHYLGLVHVWGDGNEDCGSTDYCNDTPVTAAANYGCPTEKNSCPDKTGNDMIQNYLDYTNDACMNTFTRDQVARMRTVLQHSPRRKKLWTAKPYEAPPTAPVTLKLYPNPVVSNSSLTFSGLTADNVAVQISNVLGQKIQEVKVVPAKGIATLPLGALKAGRYWATITQNGKESVLSFVVNR